SAYVDDSSTSFWLHNPPISPLFPYTTLFRSYGIPQSLPGSKMASAGKDWRTNPETQIRWGLKYIKDRYGSPSRALSFHRGHNWYDNGGWLKHNSIGINTSGKPEPVFTSRQWGILEGNLRQSGAIN